MYNQIKQTKKPKIIGLPMQLKCDGFYVIKQHYIK